MLIPYICIMHGKFFICIDRLFYVQAKSSRLFSQRVGSSRLGENFPGKDARTTRTRAWKISFPGIISRDIYSRARDGQAGIEFQISCLFIRLTLPCALQIKQIERAVDPLLAHHHQWKCPVDIAEQIATYVYYVCPRL